MRRELEFLLQDIYEPKIQPSVSLSSLKTTCKDFVSLAIST